MPKMWQFILLLFCFRFSHQNTDVNCLRHNPAILGTMSTYEKQDGVDMNITAEGFAESLFQISIRFKSFHVSFDEPSSYHKGTVETIQKGILLYKTKSTRNIPVFLYMNSNNKTNDFNSEVQMLRETYGAVLEAKSGKESPVITGIYMNLVMRTFDLQADLLEVVFGSKEFSKLPIGYLDNGCQTGFQATYLRKLLSRIHFVTCIVLPTRKETPEESADVVMNLCSEFQNNAIISNYTFEVICLTGYPSQGNAGVIGSVDHFQRFWCRITNELAKNKSRTQILMSSAFDENSPLFNRLIGRSPDPTAANHHLGWWRKGSDLSDGLIEKVEELPGGQEYDKCIGECYICTSSSNCCAEMICYSFHPSQQGEPPRVCRSQTSNCTRILEPLESTNNLEPLTVGIFSAAGILIGILFAGVAGLLLYFRMKSNRVLSQQEICNFFDGLNSSSAANNKQHDVDNSVVVDCLPYDKKMEVVKSECVIYEDQILGSGAFGVVVKGRMGKEDVAVKTTICGVDKFYLKALMLELKVLMYIGQHEHIVSLLGAHTAKLHAGELYLLLEFCPSGNLLQFLRKRRHHFMEATAEGIPEESEERRLTRKDLLQWSLQIATAMRYLEEKRVIHGDIAARNILVYSRHQVKLTDFGLSRRLYEHTLYVKTSQEPLPWRHMSIEALRDFSFSAQSDVWAFGVTMWEIFSLGEVPFPGYTWSQNFIQHLVEGLQPLKPAQAHPLLFKVMVSCWTLDIKQRPGISSVHSKLAFILDDLF